MIIEAQRLSRALSLVITRAYPVAVDLSPVLLRLGRDFRVPVHLHTNGARRQDETWVGADHQSRKVSRMSFTMLAQSLFSHLWYQLKQACGLAFAHL